MPRLLSADDVPALLAPGMTVFVAGGANEPATVLDAIRRRPGASAGVAWIQSIVPGLNRFDFSSLHDEARTLAFFITPETRASYRAGRIDFVPCQLRAVSDLLGEGLDLDLAILSVSLPRDADADLEAAADFGAGLNCDFIDVVCDRARRIVAEVNTALPQSHGRPPHRCPPDRLRGTGEPPPAALSPSRDGRRRSGHRPERRRDRPRRRTRSRPASAPSPTRSSGPSATRTTSASTPASSTTG